MSNLLRRKIPFLLLATLAVLPGCRLTRDFAPHPVRVVGTSYNPGVAMQMVPGTASEREWNLADTPLNRTISAWGDAELPAEALDPVQGRLVAKQMAKQAARRKLADAIEVVEVFPGRTIGDIIRGDTAKRQKVEALVRKAQQKALVTADSGKCSVCLSVRLHSLNAVFGLGTGAADGAGSFTVTAVPPAEFRKRAELEALENARVRTLEYCKLLPVEKQNPAAIRLLTENRLVRRFRRAPGLPPNDTLGKHMLEDDSLDRAVRQLIDDLQPDSVNFLEDGTCAVVADLDLADIHRVAAKHSLHLALAPIVPGLPSIR
jgi:hypothetical protein